MDRSKWALFFNASMASATSTLSHAPCIEVHKRSCLGDWHLPCFRGHTDFKAMLKEVARAWPMEIGDGGNLAMMLPSCRVLFYASSGNPVVFDLNFKS